MYRCIRFSELFRIIEYILNKTSIHGVINKQQSKFLYLFKKYSYTLFSRLKPLWIFAVDRSETDKPLYIKLTIQERKPYKLSLTSFIGNWKQPGTPPNTEQRTSRNSLSPYHLKLAYDDQLLGPDKQTLHLTFRSE